MTNPFVVQGASMQSPEAAQLLRRQKMAEQLLQQSQQPLESQMVSGHYIAPSWTQALAKGLQGYLGNKASDEASKGLAELQMQEKARNQAEMAKFSQMLQGKPAQTVQPLTPNDDEGNINPPIEMPAQPADTNSAYQFAAASNNPALQQMGMHYMAQLPAMQAQEKAREEERTFRKQESDLARKARMEELNARAIDQRLSQQERMEAQKDLQKMQLESRKDLTRLAAALKTPPQAQIIQTETGPMQLQGGRAMPILGPDGKPVAGKPGAGAAPGAKAKDAMDALATIEMADKLINKATGSGVGNAYDATAAFFGKSTEGAQAAAQLKALEGDLVSKMPKMSGPQSDKDVLLYRQMAGQIGDPSIPPATKKAALKTIKQMQERYAGVQPESDFEAPPAQTKQPKRIKFDAQGNILP